MLKRVLKRPVDPPPWVGHLLQRSSVGSGGRSAGLVMGAGLPVATPLSWAQGRRGLGRCLRASTLRGYLRVVRV
eukprot:4907409-Amphidinium_carterae.2